MGPKAAIDDGYERFLGVNYLGHAYLTVLLMGIKKLQFKANFYLFSYACNFDLFFFFLYTAYMGPKAATDDGYERSLGVNYLGHAYLTLLLMDKLHHCAPSKVINVCSDAYTHGQLDLNDLSLLKVCR